MSDLSALVLDDDLDLGSDAGHLAGFTPTPVPSFDVSNQLMIGFYKV